VTHDTTTIMADKRPEPLIDGRPLSSLRVVDLKQELEKRGISKSGSKKDLVDRLRVRLELESHQQEAAPDHLSQGPTTSVTEIEEPNDFVKTYIEQRQQALQKQQEMRDQAMSQTGLFVPQESAPVSTPVQPEPQPSPEQPQFTTQIVPSENLVASDNMYQVPQPVYPDLQHGLPVQDSQPSIPVASVNSNVQETTVINEPTHIPQIQQQFVEHPEVVKPPDQVGSHESIIPPIVEKENIAVEDIKETENIQLSQKEETPSEVAAVNREAEENTAVGQNEEVKSVTSTLSEPKGRESRRMTRGAEEKNGGQKPKRKWGSGQVQERQIRGITSNQLKSLLPIKEKVSSVSVEADSGQGQESNDISMTESTLSAVRTSSGPSVQKSEVTAETDRDVEKIESREKEVVSKSEDQVPSTNGSKEPTPPRHAPSQVVFIQNLTRPFTLKALEGLCRKFGEINTERFWIDKIKSKCLVTFASIEQATEARKQLHGLRWPDPNPKTLTADFSTDEEIDIRKTADEVTPLQPVKASSDRYDVIRKTIDNSDGKGDKASKRPLREWDKDKVEDHSPAKRRRSRSRTPRKDEERKKHEADENAKAPETESPAKLLDDLFKKTHATPVIYWLPLNEEEGLARAKMREDRDRERAEERARFDEERKERLARRSPPERKDRSPPRGGGAGWRGPPPDRRRSPSPAYRGGRRSRSRSYSRSHSRSRDRRVNRRSRSPIRRSPRRR